MPYDRISSGPAGGFSATGDANGRTEEWRHDATGGRYVKIDVGNLQQQAMQLFRDGKLEEALATCRRLIDVDAERADVFGFAGKIALGLGDHKTAAAYYQRAVAIRPDYAEAHYNLGLALGSRGDFAPAIDAFRAAVRIRPELPQIHHNLGNALLQLGDLDGAVAAYQRTLTIAPESAETHRNLGLAWHKAGRTVAAAAAYRRALETRPDWPDPYTNLVTALLELGDMRAANQACNAWLALRPADMEALALKCIALNELGGGAELDRLMDYDGLVQVIDHDAPPGYADLEDFNRALAEHVVAHPTMKVPPADDPTYHNPHLQITDELLVEPKGPMADLEPMMYAAMEGYRAALSAGDEHPFVANWPSRWRITSWATLLEGEGNLEPHIHLEGYLGGVYYPDVPDLVMEEDRNHAGWFELGRPPGDLPVQASPPVRLIQPLPGRMLLFPSYFYHRTVPFRSTQRRVSIAFDMIPDA